MRRHLSYLNILCCLTVLLQQPTALAGSAISVPPEARDTANAVIAVAQNTLDEQQAALYRTEAKTYAQKAEVEAAEAQLQVIAAEKTLAQHSIEAEKAAAEAQALAKQAQEAVALTAALNEKAKNAIAVAEAAYKAANAVEASLQAEEAALSQAQSTKTIATPTVRTEIAEQTSLEDTDELLKMEKEIKTLEKMQKDADLARQRNIPLLAAQDDATVDWSKAEAAHAHADRLNQIALDADKTAEQAERIADKKTAIAEAAMYKAAEERQAVLDAQLAVNDAKKTALQANDYAIQTKTELEQLIYSQDHPQGSYSFSTGMNYYRWHGVLDNRGYQITQPLYFGYWQKDFSYGLYTKYIISQNNSAGASGRVNTLSDTTLILSKRNETPKFIIDYGLSVTIPTGKSALSWPERYAMMNEDLVESSQFGKGWQFTPGIDVSWKIGKEDMWTIGTSYAFSNSYDPTSDIANDTVSPGGEWRKFLRWQHAGQDWQFVGELINTTTGQTKIANGDRYDTGAQWDYKLTYNRKLPDSQNIMFYYWRENQYINPIVPSDTSNSLAHYFGTMWSKKLDEQHVFRVTLDIMKSDGSRYAGINNYFDNNGSPQYTSIDVNGRTKYTAGLGYDIKINAKSNLSFDLQTFRMKDGKSTAGQPATTYKGFNLLAKYNRNI